MSEQNKAEPTAPVETAAKTDGVTDPQQHEAVPFAAGESQQPLTTDQLLLL